MGHVIRYEFQHRTQAQLSSFVQLIFEHLRNIRTIESERLDSEASGDHDAGGPSKVVFGPDSSLKDAFDLLIDVLRQSSRIAEADTLQHVSELTVSARELGGLELGPAFTSKGYNLMPEEEEKILFLVEAWLEALNSSENCLRLPSPIAGPVTGRRPMTLTEKIFAHHSHRIPRAEGVRSGDFIRVSVDWVIASELSWVGMKHSLMSIGREPSVWRNDRFWLAGDHVVEPRTYDQPGVRELLEGLDEARRNFKMTDNQGANYTIMHTQFVRERAEPGMLIVGSDSHTCSAGAVGSLAIGLGAADVMMALAVGETWFKVPETINVRLINRPAWYIKGKDTVLYILQQLKRNTVAADRVVEFTGPGAKYLSCDARFAICNMCTELGGITGLFAPDQITLSYIDSRARKANKSSSLYFKADDDAEYADVFDIDLAHIEPFVALYPSPDNVVPVSDRLGMEFDGCFIGACTTTEEELILAALVLEVGMEAGFPFAAGKRQVVPGSLPIVRRLRSLGLLDVYERAGFMRTAPGCSLCIAMGADKADAGEVWLSSQNRNFKNRMGKGSYGNICSAATVAASSFDMRLTDPRSLLEKVDQSVFDGMLAPSCRRNLDRGQVPQDDVEAPPFLEPHISYRENIVGVANSTVVDQPRLVKGRAYVLGDFVDTDAIIPADKILGCKTDEDLSRHCLEYTNPDFRENVRSGNNIVVAGRAFGCGSSREEAPRALKGLGVQCVIARSFSFIYGRNQPTIALLGITLDDDDFYLHMRSGVDLEIDLSARVVMAAGQRFKFVLDEMELSLIQNQGLAQAFQTYGNDVFASLCGNEEAHRRDSYNLNSSMISTEEMERKETLDW